MIESLDAPLKSKVEVVDMLNKAKNTLGGLQSPFDIAKP